MSFSGKNVAGANLRLPLYSEHCMDSSNAGTVLKLRKGTYVPQMQRHVQGGSRGARVTPLPGQLALL